MYLPLNTTSIYVIENIYDAPGFFYRIGTIFNQGEMVLINFQPSDYLLESVSNFTIEPADRKISFATRIRPYRTVYPNAQAIHLRCCLAAQTTLRNLLLCQTKDDDIIADHFFVIQDGTPMLSFHDSFKGGEMHISQDVSKEIVFKFCGQMKAKLQIKKNPVIDFAEG